MEKTLKCRSCNEVFPINNFIMKRGKKDTICKECLSIRNRKNYLKRKESGSIPREVSYEESFAKHFPEALKFWDYSKNKITPEKVSYKSTYKAQWECPLCNNQWEKPLSGIKNIERLCPNCDETRIKAGVNDVVATYPEITKWVENVSEISGYSAKSSKKFNFLCPEKGHRFTTSMIRFKLTCPICLNADKSLLRYISLAKEYSPKNRIKIEELTYNSAKRVKWVCQKSHEWETTVYQRVNNQTGCPKCTPKNYSKAEREISNWLKSLGLKVVDNDRTNGYELDIYLPESNFAIEYNGLYWHSKKHKNYHLEKYQAAQNDNIRLIQVWEDEWREKQSIVKKMILHKLNLANAKRIYARETIIQEIDYVSAKKFMEDNHIQGGTTGSIYLGLISNNILVAVSIFRKNGENLTLERYATSETVIGGLGKMLSFVIKHYNPNRVITFADHCVSNGDIYQKLNFVKTKEIKPDYKYVINGRREHKFSYRKKRFRKDPDLTFKEDLSESELALLNGLTKVYDAGKTKYELIIK